MCIINICLVVTQGGSSTLSTSGPEDHVKKREMRLLKNR